MRILLIDVEHEIADALRESVGADSEIAEFAGDTLAADECGRAASTDVVVLGRRHDEPSEQQILRATLGTWNVLTTTNARLCIQLSTMRMFDDYDAGWDVDERWSPRPSSAPRELAPYLAEITSRELSRAPGPRVVVLRLDDTDPAPGPVALHPADAAAAIARAAVRSLDDLPRGSGFPGGDRWRPLHIVSGDGRYRLAMAAEQPFGFRPAHSHPGALPRPHRPRWPRQPGTVRVAARPARVTVFGAAGPLGAAAAAALSPSCTLRLSDRTPLALAADAPSQSAGAPRPAPPEPPHEERGADVTDYADVLAAAEGADALVNLAVVRHTVVGAFSVNVGGAYNVMRAAVHHGIRTVVHTGPALVLRGHPYGNLEDRAVSEATPPHPGDDLYLLTKHLGLEICRVIAEEHGIAVPALLMTALHAPGTPIARLNPFAVSWQDAGRAIAAATLVGELPEPCPVIHVMTPSPFGRYTAGRAQDLLDWRPRDSLVEYWRRPDSDPGIDIRED